MKTLQIKFCRVFSFVKLLLKYLELFLIHSLPIKIFFLHLHTQFKEEVCLFQT